MKVDNRSVIKIILKQYVASNKTRFTYPGFTFVELLAVFALIGILTALTVAGFNSYNQAQTFETSVSDVSNMLGTAKSRALSQVNPCAVGQLNGYQVKITPGGSNYELDVVCSGVPPIIIEKKVLPQNVTFKSPGSFSSVLFTVLTGTPIISPSPPPLNTITIIEGSRVRVITIGSTGVITVT